MNNRQNGRRRGRGGGSGGGNAPRPMGQPSANRMEVRVRGNASQLLEKYRQMARDAHQSGDRVAAEYYLQYADHYFRVLNDGRIRQDAMRARQNMFDPLTDEEMDDGRDDDDADEGEDEAEEPREGFDRSRNGANGQARDRWRDGRAERPRDDRSREDRPREDRPQIRADERRRDDRQRRDERPRERALNGERTAEGDSRRRDDGERRRDGAERPRDDAPRFRDDEGGVRLAREDRAPRVARDEDAPRATRDERTARDEPTGTSGPGEVAVAPSISPPADRITMSDGEAALVAFAPVRAPRVRAAAPRPALAPAEALVAAPPVESGAPDVAPAAAEAPAAPRRRGRPRKVVQPVAEE